MAQEQFRLGRRTPSKGAKCVLCACVTVPFVLLADCNQVPFQPGWRAKRWIGRGSETHRCQND